MCSGSEFRASCIYHGNPDHGTTSLVFLTSLLNLYSSLECFKALEILAYSASSSESLPPAPGTHHILATAAGSWSGLPHSCKVSHSSWLPVDNILCRMGFMLLTFISSLCPLNCPLIARETWAPVLYISKSSIVCKYAQLWNNFCAYATISESMQIPCTINIQCSE